MESGIPSRTALRVAMRRAAHQLHDARPLVFEDPIAIRLLPGDAQADVQANGDNAHPVSLAMRSWMVARSRFADDELRNAVGRGVRQCVLLGAGLDTFAWRNPHGRGLRVFEVDHPATQAWKRELAAASRLGEPETTRYVPVDFERDSLAECLSRAGLETASPSFFSWLGVVPYLTLAAFRQTIEFLGQNGAGSGLVFDYSLPAEALSGRERQFQEYLASRVMQAGEPFRLFFLPEEVREELRRTGWAVTSDLDGAALHERYFRDRSDGLGLRGRAGHLLSAEIRTRETS
jgi:methyltransferase (TIGR00027 family)